MIMQKQPSDIEDLLEVKYAVTEDPRDISIEFIIEQISEQMRYIGESNITRDYMLMFFNHFLSVNGDDTTSIYDSSIYLEMTMEQKEALDKFLSELNGLFFKFMGIRYNEYTARSMYYLYQVMVLNLNMYLFHYIDGLGKEYNEFSENIEEFNVQYIEKKEEFKKISDSLMRRTAATEYLINYVKETSLYPEHLFEIMLYSSEEDDSLLFLLNEHENFRLDYIESFFRDKLVKIMGSEVYFRYITNEYMNSLKNIPLI